MGTWRTILILMAFCSMANLACATSSYGPASSNAADRPSCQPAYDTALPAWVRKPNLRQDDRVIRFLGVGLGRADRATARESAISNTEEQFRSAFEESTPGLARFIETEYHRFRCTNSNPVHDAWVLVAVPIEKWTEMEIIHADCVAIGLICEAPQGTCGSELLDQLEGAAIQGKLRPAARRLTEGEARRLYDQADQSAGLAQTLRVAKILLVRVQAKFLGEDQGEFYAEANGSFRLIDTLAEKMVESQQTGWQKEGAYSEGDAIEKAIERTADRLTSRIQWR